MAGAEEPAWCGWWQGHCSGAQVATAESRSWGNSLTRALAWMGHGGFLFVCLIYLYLFRDEGRGRNRIINDERE